MGLLDQVIGGLKGGAGGGGSPIQGMLMSMLGGGQQAGVASGGQEVDQGMEGPVTGGLAGIISGFERAGLGHIVQSWIGNGPNQPVSPQQLQGVFGNDRVQTMAVRREWLRTISCRSLASIYPPPSMALRQMAGCRTKAPYPSDWTRKSPPSPPHPLSSPGEVGSMAPVLRSRA